MHHRRNVEFCNNFVNIPFRNVEVLHTLWTNNSLKSPDGSLRADISVAQKMFTLIYQLFAAVPRHRSADTEIGASSPFWGVKKHRQRHILRCCVDCACGPGIKRKAAVSLDAAALYTSFSQPAKQLFRRRTRALP